MFRATYRGAPAAAKVIDLGLHAAALLLNTAQLKAVLTARTLDHPHIVKTLDFAIATEEGSSACSTPRVSVSTPRSNVSTPRAGAAREHRSLWIVQEYCNRGMLNDACDRGWFRVERSPTGAPHMRFILRTAIEVAGALRYLHGKGLVQGLNSKSVLLTASTKDDRGFQAMLGSSALPGLLGARHSRLGTVSHMWVYIVSNCETAVCNIQNLQPSGWFYTLPITQYCRSPELLLDRLSTPAADVYAFGVMLWEMYCGGRAWAGRSPAQVVELISMGRAVLPLPEATPPKFAQLVAQCMEFDHTKRPTMDEVFEAIIGMLVAC